jgi:hypothetical protein
MNWLISIENSLSKLAKITFNCQRVNSVQANDLLFAMLFILSRPMNSTGSAPTPDSGLNKNPPSQVASTYQLPTRQSAPPLAQKRAIAQPGDLTSRLVGIALWFCFGTTVGCISQMAVTRRPPNLGAGMAIGMAAALTSAYKDLEHSQTPRGLPTHPQKRLEEKLDRLSKRIDALPVTLPSSPAPVGQAQSLDKAIAHSSNGIHLNGNGSHNSQSRNSLGAGF